MQVETADGTRLHCIDWGKGPPILFLHGWSQSSAAWARQMYPLASKGRRCIAYDQRGHGRSDDPGAGFDLDTLAEDLACVMERLDLTEASLVGHSMGCGEIVRYLSRRGSARVSRIVLIGTTTPCLMKSASTPMGVDLAMFDIVRGQLLADFPGWLRDNARPFVTPETSEATIDWLMAMSLGASFKAVMDCNAALFGADFRSDLPRIDVPSLVVHGDLDASSPLALTARPTASLIPGAVLHVYEGAPHGLFITHAERLNADLEAFVPRSRALSPAGH